MQKKCHLYTSSKYGLFPFLILVLCVSPHTCTLTTGLMLFPGNWRPSITRTRIFDKNKNNNILKWLIKQMRSTFKMEETFVKITTGGCCTWKSWGLLAKLWRFLVLDRSFWPGSPGDVTAPGTPASVTSPSSPPADQCTFTKKKKCIMQHVIGQTYAVWQTCNSHIQS